MHEQVSAQAQAARARVAAAQARIGELTARRGTAGEDNLRLRQARNALAQARLQLQYSSVRADRAGTLSNLQLTRAPTFRPERRWRRWWTTVSTSSPTSARNRCATCALATVRRWCSTRVPAKCSARGWRPSTPGSRRPAGRQRRPRRAGHLRPLGPRRPAPAPARGARRTSRRPAAHRCQGHRAALSRRRPEPSARSRADRRHQPAALRLLTPCRPSSRCPPTTCVSACASPAAAPWGSSSAS